MTQHKAASLTSNLFARKGRASPASLLIAELEGVAPEDVAATHPGPQPKAGGDNGLRLDLKASNLNGSAAKKAKEPELPLLAFVEAQTAAEKAETEDPAEERAASAAAEGEESAGSAAERSDEPTHESTGGQRAGGEGAGTGAEEAAETNAGEMRPPAASLLDSGAWALRKANGRRPAAEGGFAGMPGAEKAGAAEAALRGASAEKSGDANGVPMLAPEALSEAAPEAAEAAAGEENLEAETVSGDANVAAIEDAPHDEPHQGDDPQREEAAAVAAASSAPVESPADAEVVDAELNEDTTGGKPASAKKAAKEAAVEDKAALAAAPGPEIAAAAPSTEAESVSAGDVGAGTPAAEAKTEAEEAAGQKEDSAEAPAAAAVARKAESDKVLSATVALRQAKALQPDALPPSAAKPSAKPAAAASPAGEKGAAEKPMSMPPPKAAGAALPWRSAAVIGLGIALGLGAYVVFSGRPQPPAVEAEAPLAEKAVPPGDAAPTGEAAASAPQTAVAPIAPKAAPAESEAPPPAAAQLPEPSFDIIRIEPDGQSIIAGRAAPGSEWILLNNGQPIASVKADANGEWVILPDASLVPGANAFSLVPKTERGKVAIPAPSSSLEKSPAPSAPGGSSDAAAAPAAEIPAADESTSGLPAAQSAQDDIGIVLPKPKPAMQSETPLPVVAVAVDGAYELQVASVRQSADAERERSRLAAAFPGLLGPLDLRVQEARVEGSGTFFRVRSGAIEDLGTAREICRRLEARGQGCLVVRRAPDEAPQTEVVQEERAPRLPPKQQAERPQ